MVTPTLSVVIPVLNDAEPLRQCLQVLLRQDLGCIEIIVVDNGSSDGGAALARSCGARVVDEPVRGIPAAAAAGYDAARGDIIVRCDADSLPPQDWLRRISAAFEADPQLAALTGPGDFYGLGKSAGYIISRLYMHSYRLAMGAALAHEPLFGSNMAFRRTVWEQVRTQVHRADAELHDDVDLSYLVGPLRRIRYDRRLRVGISARALAGRDVVALRFRRAFHTLGTHWPADYPWLRWQQRLRNRFNAR